MVRKERETREGERERKCQGNQSAAHRAEGAATGANDVNELSNFALLARRLASYILIGAFVAGCATGGRDTDQLKWLTRWKESFTCARSPVGAAPPRLRGHCSVPKTRWLTFAS